jgi:PleD family two-component response regulator
MKSKSACVIATLAAALALAPPALACGEGAFNMGEGLHYQGYLASHPANVLVLDGHARDRKPLYAGLQKAGHTVTVVDSLQALVQALHGGRFDVVIADLDEASTVRAERVSDAVRLLPVVARNQRRAPEVLREFKLVLPDGASLGQTLRIIDQLLSRSAS